MNMNKGFAHECICRLLSGLVGFMRTFFFFFQNNKIELLGESVMNWEIRFDINTIPSVKEIASGKLLYGTASSA